MRRVRQWVDPARLAVYEGIIELYAPYVLIRCARYTNRRRQAQQIGVYTLVTACLLASELPWMGQLSLLLDMVVDVIGPDIVSRGQGASWWAESRELLLVDERMRRLVRALNRLRRPLRAVLVLHHVGGVEPEPLARLLEEPAAQVAARIGRGERALARRLGMADVRALLARFAAGLDTGWIQEVAGGALDYLARPARRDWN